MAIFYDFIEDGGRSNQQMSLINTGSSAVEVQAIQITTNANIQSPWQTFGNQWSNVQVQQNGNLYTYTLPLNPAVSVPPGSTIALEYSVSTALGPVTNVAMPPQQVQLQTQGQTGWQPITLNNPTPQTNPNPKVRLTVYHASWGQYQYLQTMAQEAWNVINGLAYAFIGIDMDADGGVLSLDPWGDLLELPLLGLQAQRLPYLNTTLSFGGWTNNNQMMAPVFSQMTANPTALQNFVTNSVAAVKQIGANGIDIDWEYPATPQDAANYILLLTQLRAALGPSGTLTIAAPAGIDKIKVFTAAQWQQIAGLVNDIRIMSYDYFGAFSTYADFLSAWQLSPNSPYYNDPVNSYYCVQQSLAVYQSMGVPAEILSMGIPDYTRAMLTAEEGNYGGLYQEVVGAPQGDFPGSNGVYSWNSIQNLLNNQPSPLDQLGVAQWNYYDSTNPLCTDAQMCVLSGQMQNGQWVVLTFLDPTSATLRAQQAVQMGLGGTMIWANYFESTNPANKIVDAVSAGLNSPSLKVTPNLASPKAEITTPVKPTRVILTSAKSAVVESANPSTSPTQIKGKPLFAIPSPKPVPKQWPQIDSITQIRTPQFEVAPAQLKSEKSADAQQTEKRAQPVIGSFFEEVMQCFGYEPAETNSSAEKTEETVVDSVVNEAKRFCCL